MKKLIKHVVFICCLLIIGTLTTLAQSKIKVACVGNSITEGVGLKKPYPEVLQELLGEQYEVHNYGISARTLLKKGDYPFWNEAKYQDALAWQPDIVIIKLGTNDTKPQNWKYKEEYVKDYIALINSFKTLPSKPKVYICNPIPVFEDKWGINEAALKNEVLPAVQKVARKTKANVIDLYTPFLGKANLTYDSIHPNDEGAAFLAKLVHQAITPGQKVQ